MLVLTSILKSFFSREPRARTSPGRARAHLCTVVRPGTGYGLRYGTVPEPGERTDSTVISISITLTDSY
jgi:hypothetical protein